MLTHSEKLRDEPNSSLNRVTVGIKHLETEVMIYSNSKWSGGYQNRRKRIRYVSYHRNSACLRIYNVIVYYNTNQISLR